ncbi:hypothetical protein HanIR_Chr04g0181161 [Helianthus annuus]|nr:hypothetical protein HanIR_Chr04g0181161 [Helianthus annuus]
MTDQDWQPRKRAGFFLFGPNLTRRYHVASSPLRMPIQFPAFSSSSCNEFNDPTVVDVGLRFLYIFLYHGDLEVEYAYDSDKQEASVAAIDLSVKSESCTQIYVGLLFVI